MNDLVVFQPQLVHNIAAPAQQMQALERLGRLAELRANAFMSRVELLTKMMDGQGRDLDQECGYPPNITPAMYRQMYERDGIANRVVGMAVRSSWASRAVVYETEDADTVTPFEAAWQELGRMLAGGSWLQPQEDQGHPLLTHLERLDRLSGVGRYGVLLLGLDDGAALDQPVKFVNDPLEAGSGESSLGDKTQGSNGGLPTPGHNSDRVTGQRPGRMLGTPMTNEAVPPALRKLGDKVKALGLGSARLKGSGTEDDPVEVDDDKLEGEQADGAEVLAQQPRKLLFVRAFDESRAPILEWDTDLASPRYGQPTMYGIRLSSLTQDQGEWVGGTDSDWKEVNVHWTRVIHVADNCESNEIMGVPRLRDVFNRLLDLRKTLGGSAEMFYRGAFMGLSFELHPDLAGTGQDLTGTRDAIASYQRGLQRSLVTEGGTVNPIAPQVADPSAHIDAAISAICIAKEYPKRVFIGSERGELASSQDERAWQDRMKHRQVDHNTPRLIAPLVDRLIAVGCLPAPEHYHVWWPDLQTKTDGERAAVAVQVTEALSKYVAGGVNAIMPEVPYFTMVLGWTPEEAEAVQEAALEAEQARAEEDEIERTLQAEADEQNALLQAEAMAAAGVDPMMMPGAPPAGKAPPFGAASPGMPAKGPPVAPQRNGAAGKPKPPPLPPNSARR